MEVKPAVREAAEREMGRLAPENRSDGGSRKRQKTGTQSSRTGDTKEETESLQYEYQAAEPLLRGASGFLVNCSFKREKSAISEIVPLLQRYTRQAMVQVGGGGGNFAVEDTSAKEKTQRWRLRPVKLAARGLIFLWLHEVDNPSAIFPGVPSAVAVAFVGDVASGAEPMLRWCHRLMPVERSCPLRLVSLEETAAECAARHLKHRRHRDTEGDKPSDGLPCLTYAVRFNIRDGQTANKTEVGLERAGVTAALAKVFAAQCEALYKPSVDLSHPEVVIFGESVALASGEELGLLCVLDASLATMKPKMRMRAISTGNAI